MRVWVMFLAAFIFLLTALSAFSDDVNLNEIGFLALGLMVACVAVIAPGRRNL